MEPKHDIENLGGYIDTMVVHKGVSIVTVNDGWVMVMSKDKLRDLLETAKDEERVLIFIKKSPVPGTSGTTN